MSRGVERRKTRVGKKEKREQRGCHSEKNRPHLDGGGSRLQKDNTHQKKKTYRRFRKKFRGGRPRSPEDRRRKNFADLRCKNLRQGRSLGKMGGPRHAEQARSYSKEIRREPPQG